MNSKKSRSKKVNKVSKRTTAGLGVKAVENGNAVIRSAPKSKPNRSIKPVKKSVKKSSPISKPKATAKLKQQDATVSKSARLTESRKRSAASLSQTKQGKDITPAKKVKRVAIQNSTKSKVVRKRNATGKTINARKLKLITDKVGETKLNEYNLTSQQPVVVKMPPKFSYVVDGLLAGQGRPTQHGHIQFLCDRNFKYLVTLTLNKPRTILEYPGDGLTWVHIPIQDDTPPSLDQIKEFVALVERAKEEKVSVAVHCAWGRGRTGTMLACYLAKTGHLSCDEALNEIRRLRPGSVDNDKQKAALRGYVESLESVA